MVTVDPRLHRTVTAQPYPLLFATISGAHLYGFPSPDSDFDLRGAHVLPLDLVKRFLRIIALISFALVITWEVEGAEVRNADDVFCQFTNATRSAALASYWTMIMEGRVVSMVQNFEGGLRVSKSRPAKVLIETAVEGYGMVRIGFDGTNGWQLEPNQTLQRLSANAIAGLREEADFLPVNYSRERVKKIRLRGRSMIEQAACYRLEVTREDGSEVLDDFSIATGLLVARSKPNRVLELFADYREFGGVLFPTRIETRRGSETEQMVTITNVAFHAVPEEKFYAREFTLRPGFLAPAVRNTPGKADHLDAVVQRTMDDLGIPGLAFAVVRGGTVIKAAGYGLADLERKTPVSTETVFEIGSMAKVFTATIVMQLAQERKLKLDDSIGKWLTNCPPAWRKITVRHLLTHTSGLRQSIVPGTLFREVADEEIIARAAKMPLQFQPGENWSYSNIGYQLLGAIIQRSSGRTWPEEWRARIFLPLDMANTQRMSASVKVGPRATGYMFADGGTISPGLYDPSGTAAGNALSTLGDLARWDSALGGDLILSQKMLEEMWRPCGLNRGKANWYGTGWFLDEYKGHRIVYHGGDTVSGFTSLLMRFPENKLTIILFCNRLGVDKQRVGRLIADEFLTPTENTRP